MQSFLQYRRFKKNVTVQYETHREKVLASGRNGLNSGHSSPTLGRLSDPDLAASSPLSNRQDPEKAESFNRQRSEKGDVGDDLAPSVFDGRLEEDRRPELCTFSTARTQNSIGINIGYAMTGIEVRDRTRTNQKAGGDSKVFVVAYEGEDDMMNPHNWSRLTRWGATVTIASIGWVVGFASSIDSGALQQAAAEFGVSEVTESLATGLFLIGFGCGALIAGPISETVGRNPVYISTLSLYMIFVMASGLAPNIGAQLTFRFLAGLFGSTPLTCAGGSISDLWSPMERVYAFPVFANAAFMGPIFGPVVGGFIGQNTNITWRWVEWVTLIISGLVLVLVILFQPETYAPILLKWKAAHLRSVTGESRYCAEVEIREDTFLRRIRTALYRPFLLTFREPIIMLFALYLTVIYIMLFTFLNGYTFIFTETYGLSQGLTGLAFLGIAIGLCGGSLLVPLIYRWAQTDLAKIKAAGGERLPPEFRLWFSMFGAPAIPISMFWMAWTSYPSISLWSPLAASVLFGYGILCIFISCYQYIIDSYEAYSASALASVTLIRYVVAGGMVEAAIPLYTKLGVHWTLSLLGFLSLLLVPVPYLFYFYGPKIRKMSKYAVVHD
ncbi:hypothetical protein MMC17_006584 [Xylographa soralifera]|nr:hypothetical protein [Xylographa soralifera]